MPPVYWPTVNIYYQTFTGTGLNINSSYSSKAYRQNDGLLGGEDLWYYTNSVTIPSASPPTGYSHKWQFVAWYKNSGSMQYTTVEKWRKAWGDLGYGYRLPINEIINRDTGVELPAYNGEVFNYYFHIVQTTGIGYSYTYVYNNGDANSIIEVRYGDTITLSIGTKSKTGHYFDYFTSPTYGNKANNSSFVYNITGFATFSAVWTVNTYTATLKYGNGAADTTATYNYNSDFTLASTGFTRTGYTFSGWTSNPDIGTGTSFKWTNAGNIIFTGQWVANTYTATLKYGNGAADTTATYNYNSAFTLESTGFTRTGYTFSGWTSNPNIGTGTSFTWTNAGNITFTGQWAAIPYTATLIYGNGDANTTATYNYNSAFTLASTGFTRTGYTFSGWTSNPNIGTGTSFTWTNAGNITFTGQWVANTYTATLIYGNGAANTTATYNYNSAFTLASTGFTRTGYTFSGWTSNPNIGTGTSFTWTNAGNITFTGQWVANTYTATLIYGNGAANTTATYTYDSALVLASTGFTRTGYTFSGWTSNPNIGTGTSFTWTNAGNITFTGQWAAIPYTATLIYGNGAADTTATYNYNSAFTLESTGFTRTGYTFSGWTSNPNIGTGTSFTWTNAGNITFTGQWVANTYTATLIYGNGAANTTATYTYDSALVLASTGFTRTGYTFSGWTSNPNIGTGTSFTWTNAGNITFTGQWVANTYRINYNTGNNAGDLSVSGNTPFTSAAYPNNISIASSGFTRTGYTFIGWGISAGGAVNYYQGTTIAHPGTGDTLELYAIWIRSYNLTFNNSGMGGTISTVYSGVSNTVISDFPTLGNIIGYIFSGWMNNNVLISSITLTADVTLYAKWNAVDNVSFSSLQNIFGGNYPINLSEYYSNNGYVNRPGGVGVPTSGEISMSHFLNKYKSTYIYSQYITMFDNTVADLDLTNGFNMIGVIGNINIDGQDDDFAKIGVIGFPFYWFGTDYGSLDDIYWNTNTALTFGGGSWNYRDWKATNAKGVLMGQKDRRTVIARQFAPFVQNGHDIKRIVVKQDNSFKDGGSGIQMEILLMRGKVLPIQYIVIRMGLWNSTNAAGIWNISDGKDFKNIFEGTPPVGTGNTVVLIGDAYGIDWASYNLPYKDAITIMGEKLILYHTGYNTDGNNNNVTVFGSLIANWKNISNSSFVTKQDLVERKPKYNGYQIGGYGIEFSNGKVLSSNINLHNYPQMNIFIVWRKNAVINGEIKNIFAMGGYGFTYLTRRLYYADNTIYGSYFALGVGGTTYDSFGVIKLPLNSTIIMNFEFDSPGNIGKTYINGEYLGYFTNGQLDDTNLISNSQFLIGPWFNTSNNDVAVSTIYEIIVINRLLTDTERRNIHNLLCSKWNIFDDITSMTINLVLRYDAKNVDGDNNMLSNGSKIAIWHNSASPNDKNDYYFTQTTESAKPTYINNSVVFTAGNSLVNDIDITINNYQILNIIVVWKMTQSPASFYYLWTDTQLYRSLTIYSDNTIRFKNGFEGSTSIANTYPLNTTIIYNLEYNLVGLPGNFYINNISQVTFTTLIATSPISSFGSATYFGGYALSNSIIGEIYEIIIIDRLLTTTERTKIYNLLKAKWNVP